MTITLKNVDYDFLNAIKALLSLNKSVELVRDDEPNEITLQAIKEVEAGKTNKISSMDDLWKKIERRK